MGKTDGEEGEEMTNQFIPVPIDGCQGCNTAAGVWGCPIHRNYGHEDEGNGEEMKKTRLQEIIERLDLYKKEVKGEQKHNVLMSENVYIEDVEWLLKELGRKK